jgi:hypothetical protein
MAERLFLFVQFEFPWELGPPDGRYVIRAPASDDPQHVLVLKTLASAPRRRAVARGASSWRRRGTVAAPAPEPSRVAVARATVVDPVSLSAEHQAQAWLAELDPGRDVDAAASALNRALYLHRIASADPYVREISPAEALVTRAGWGEGEQVAEGRWLHARELPLARRGPRRGRWPGGSTHSAALRPGERFAQLLGGRAQPLLCEELTLRARLDLDEQRLRHAALELHAAYASALPELRAEGREELAVRLGELEQLAAGVLAQERIARTEPEREPDVEVVRHGLERLEAALRARTAGGLG